MVRGWLSQACINVSGWFAKLAFALSEERSDLSAAKGPFRNPEGEVVEGINLTSEAVSMRADLTPSVTVKEPEPEPLEGSIEERLKRKW